MPTSLPILSNFDEAAAQLRDAAAAKKCHPCGCLHDSLRAIAEAIPRERRSEHLTAAIDDARARLTDVKYDCLGCEVCWPANAVNLLGVEGESCAAAPVEEREGWPPLPGNYIVRRYHAPVAVCTLTDDELAQRLAAAAGPALALVGTMQTENLGIERLIHNTIANPNIRFVLLCGPDSRQTIGHLPGASLLALAERGLDERGRIINAPGRRPVLRNLEREAVEHFRAAVEVVDLIGQTDDRAILDAIEQCAQRNPGPVPHFDTVHGLPARIRDHALPARVSNEEISISHGLEAHAPSLPRRMVPDPCGWFVIHLDRARRLLILEHYTAAGVLDAFIEARTAAEAYCPAIERALLSRLDHAAYLGRELARAEQALHTGGPYVQDAAPEGR